MAGSKRGLIAAWLRTCSTTPDIHGTGSQPESGFHYSHNQRGRNVPHIGASEISMMLRLVLSLPTASLRGREYGKHPGAFPLLIGYLSSEWSGFRAEVQNRGLRGVWRVWAGVALPEKRSRQCWTLTKSTTHRQTALRDSGSIALARVYFGQIL